jgi:Tol biopolymer transport system component
VAVRALVVAVVSLLVLFVAGCLSSEHGPTGPEPPPVVPGLVVFVSDRDESHGEIYVMKDDGTNVHRLTFNSVVDAAPVLSPDGTRILFRRELNPDNVMVMNVDGSGQAGLTPGSRAEWSPDGTQIAVAGDSLAVMKADATGMRTIGVGAAFVTWKPDGTRLAYVSTGLAGQAVNDIYTIAPNGTGALRVTQDGTPRNSLAWSPDGTKLVFGAPAGIQVIPAAGGAPTFTSPGRNPRWSPDGTRIIFATDAYNGGGNDDLYTIRLDGSGLQNLSHSDAGESEPDWGPRP